MERGLGAQSAVQEVESSMGIPVIAIATLNDLMTFIKGRSELVMHGEAIAAYRAEFGVEYAIQ